MKVSDLINEVARLGGDVRTVYTGEGNPEDRYAIVRQNHVWAVYYTERGQPFDLRHFKSEDEACEYLFSLLQADEPVWRH